MHAGGGELAHKQTDGHDNVRNCEVRDGRSTEPKAEYRTLWHCNHLEEQNDIQRIFMVSKHAIIRSKSIVWTRKCVDIVKMLRTSDVPLLLPDLRMCNGVPVNVYILITSTSHQTEINEFTFNFKLHLAFLLIIDSDRCLLFIYIVKLH